ncbi:hypothetical protein F2Q69_00039109 [Brassica cretica]|uniref:RNase H type-1 domain-containing protein n=1 Tax=Brassica cretica TaxID=69181 RepID=A0A8S9SIF3_BRACR|nr:hypothetical protein F2Q69_00039109 [Brassica cretica]
MVTVRSDAVWSPLGTNARLGWVVLSPAAHQCFQKHTPFVSSALVAEGLALLEAVQTLAKEERAMVSFESDSEQLIKTINDENYIPELGWQTFYLMLLCLSLWFLFGSLAKRTL